MNMEYMMKIRINKVDKITICIRNKSIDESGHSMCPQKRIKLQSIRFGTLGSDSEN